MIYRKLTASGDYTYGQNNQDFLHDIDAVAQCIKTRMQLYKDTFWRDLSDGLPMFQSILGTPGSPSNLIAVDNILQDRIRNSTGVTGIVSYSSNFDHDLRQYSFEATVQTIYSQTVVSGVI